VLPIAAALLGADPTPIGVGTGVALMVLGEGIRLWGTAHLGHIARSSSPRAARLVTTGPFARTRHPLYWGNLCLTLGFVVATGAWAPWLAVLAGAGYVLLYTRHAREEEAVLAAAFPAAHAAWRSEVPAWRWRRRPVPHTPAGEADPPSWRRALEVEAGAIHAELWLLVALRLRALLPPLGS
jgi:protein-S-isoprenylcysteine O-methyltransferase Ste14